MESGAFSDAQTHASTHASRSKITPGARMTESPIPWLQIIVGIGLFLAVVGWVVFLQYAR